MSKSNIYYTNRMIQRALELKERRERARLAIVEEKRMQQYRYLNLIFDVVFHINAFPSSESCDDLRVEDSKKIGKMVMKERESQLEERKRIEEEEVGHILLEFASTLLMLPVLLLIASN